MIFIAYLLLFGAGVVFSYRKKGTDSDIPIISWRYLIVMSMVIIGLLLLRLDWDIKEYNSRPKIRIEIQKERPIIQQVKNLS